MLDPWRDYDRWKLMSPEDIEDERQRREEREQERYEDADRKYDELKDEGRL